MSAFLNALSNYNIILASSSPQRKQLLQQIGLIFKVIPSTFDEEAVAKESFENPDDYVKLVAHGKAQAVAETLANDDKNCLVIGADTVIVDSGRIIGKPHTPSVAIATLQRLSNKSHSVHTGVCVVKVESGKMSNIQFREITEVRFGNLTREEIMSYVSTGEPLNKAGAYGIQGIGATLVESINGDYNNVVGFPLYRFCRNLNKFLLNEETET